MKRLFTLLLCCLACLGVADIDLRNPLPRGQITVKQGKLVIERNQVFLYGANFTFDSVTAYPPKDFAQYCLKRGMNWVRFHKIKDGIDILPYVEALYEVGIRSSIDILLAEDGPAFYSGNLTKFNTRATALQGVLKQPGLFAVCIVNEGGTALRGSLSTSPSISIELAKTTLRSMGFTGLIGDLPDANIDPPQFVDEVSHLDVALAHGYGIHPQGLKYQEPIWMQNPHFAGVSYWLRDLTGKPLLFQELGCLFPDHRRHLNESFLIMEGLTRGLNGVCLFQWASNHGQMRGEAGVIDMFSIATDPVRQVSYFAGAMYAKTKGVIPSTTLPWTVESNIGPYSGFIVFKKGKQRVVILLGRSAVDGFSSKDVGSGWLQIDKFGSRKMWHPEGDWFDLGTPIASAYRTDTFSMGRAAQMRVEGNRFQPDRELGVFEVTLK